jgi:hypothetical protein
MIPACTSLWIPSQEIPPIGRENGIVGSSMEDYALIPSRNPQHVGSNRPVRRTPMKAIRVGGLQVLTNGTARAPFPDYRGSAAR